MAKSRVGSVMAIYFLPMRLAGLSKEEVEAISVRRLTQLARKENAYRRGRPPMTLEDRTVILVDDGAATGSSMRAAALALREILKEADEVVCVMSPEPFRAMKG